MQGVIFDLDGTLLDSMPLWRMAARNYLRDNYGIYADESLADEVLKLTITEAAELVRTRYGLAADTAVRALTEHTEISVRSRYLFALFIRNVRKRNVNSFQHVKAV